MESLDKLSNIIDGWKNVIFPSEKVEKLAKARALICANCFKNENNKCSLCGCFLTAKVRSTKITNNCPLNKWKK